MRSLLEQSCVLWHSSLTEDNTDNLERVQKVSLRVILKNSYHTYETALKTTSLQTLKERREKLCLKFAKSCIKNPFSKSMFPLKTNNFYSRQGDKFEVQNANTTRLLKSSIPYMQRLLNYYC